MVYMTQEQLERLNLLQKTEDLTPDEVLEKEHLERVFEKYGTVDHPVVQPEE